MKNLKYAFLTCTLTYAIGALLLFIFSVAQTGWSRIDSDTGTCLASGLTLALSEFQWWGDFWYLAVLVPWLGSSLLMVLLMTRFNYGAGRRWLLGGTSIFTYYLVMILVFIIHGLIEGWGDIGYGLFPLWLIIGFGLGYLSAVITDKMVEFRVTD